MLESVLFEEDKVTLELRVLDHLGDVNYDYIEYDADTPIVDVLQRHCNRLVQDVRDEIVFWSFCNGHIVKNTLFNQLFG